MPSHAPAHADRRRLASLLLAACKDEQRNAYVAPPPPAVTVAAPAVQAVTEYVELTGTTAAVATVQLVARVQGFLEQIHFADGARVKKGDLLFTIQQDTYQAELQQAQAEVGAVQARLEQAQTEFARYSGLFKQKAASAVDVDTWRANLDGAQADLLGAQAKVALAQINLGYTTVTAPFDGRMGRHLIDAGNLVGPGGAGTVLAEINRIDPIYAYFTINERELLRIRGERSQGVGAAGQPVDQVLQLGVANEDGFPHAGKLDFAAITLTAGTGTLQLRGVFPNPDYQLLPGLFARIRAPIGGRAGALLVPETVIGRDQAGTYVLTVDKDDVVHRTGVELGQLVGTNRVVASGLDGRGSGGDRRPAARGPGRQGDAATTSGGEAPPPAKPAG